ncbi:MAG: hypothetical protein B6V02_01850 [Thermoprotei archaeon ex4572_64]|nr:MAG: hypothetical protein B6V02_01850 [Thermoprotei archaeon ex4572_64]
MSLYKDDSDTVGREWLKIAKEIERISENNYLEVLVNLVFNLPEGTLEVESSVMSMYNVIEEILSRLKSRYLVNYEEHLSEDLTSLFISLSTRRLGSEVIKFLRDVINEVERLPIKLRFINGEVYLDDDLVVIFFGDNYRLTFIYPNPDGKRLSVQEIIFSPDSITPRTF